MTALLHLVLVVTLAQSITGAPQVLPPAQRGGDVDPKGSALIRGRVTAADTGRPLRRARITVSGSPLVSGRSTSTNARGEFEIKDLPAGRFTIYVTRGGYIPTWLGQRTPDEPPRPLELVEGQTVDKVDFALPRMGIISGRVVDETGEAVGDVVVYAMRPEFYRGRRRFVPVGRDVRTDDTGRYRLLNVPPGEFVVMASLRETWVAGRERHVYGYAATYFPSVASVRDAARVKVALGQETPNTDIALVASRAAVISGIATRSDGAPLAGASVSLGVQMMGPSGGTSFGLGSSAVAADGSWRIPNIPPGEYHLEVTSRDRERSPERASTTLVVQGADISGVALVADAGGTVSGTIVADGGRQLPSSTAPVRVTAHGVGPDQAASGVPPDGTDGRVDEGGRFALSGVFGPSLLRVVGLPRGWDVLRIESSGRDLSDAPIEVRGGQTLEFQIVVTDRLPHVQGRVTNEKGESVEGVVLLFPADTAKWVDASLLRTARPDQSGTFRFEQLRPGDYLAIALRTVARWQAADPEFLEGLRSRATSVTLREGASEQLSLRVR